MTPSPNAISSSITTYFSNHQLAEPIQHMRQPYFATSNLIRAMWHPGRTGSKRNPSQRMTLTRWRGAPTAYAEAATGCWAGRMAYVHVRHVFSRMSCHVLPCNFESQYATQKRKQFAVRSSGEARWQALHETGWAARSRFSLAVARRRRGTCCPTRA